MQNPTWLQRNEHFDAAAPGGDSNSRGLFNATTNANAIKTRQAAVAVNQQAQQQQQNSHFAVLRVRPGGNNIHPSNKSAIITKSSPPQRATPEGISIGTLSTAVFHCNNDPMVSPEHGTLECTSKHGIWVYVDHSVHGTKLNNSRRIHKEAVVVRTGDRLLVGNTEIELHFESSSGDDAHQQDDMQSRPIDGRQYTHAQSNSSSDNQKGIAPSPIACPPASGEGARKLDHFEIEKPKVVTSDDSFATPTSLEYVASPIPAGSYSRRKRHSMTAFTPSPPGGGGGVGTNPFMYHHTRPLVPSAPSTPPRLDATRPCTAANISPHQPHGVTKWRTSQPEDDNNNSNDTEDTSTSSSRSAKSGRLSSTPPPPPPPPLSYSPSPVAAPILAQRVQQQQQQSHLPQNSSPPLVPQQQPQRLHTEAPKSSQRDNLRIQVSKKMAGYHAAVESKRAGGKSDSLGGRPIPGSLRIPSPSTPPSLISPSSAQSNDNQLDFTPPSSPVAHKDILRQKESLLNILKNKYKEEQLLKQQQEEWMRHNFNLASPPMSPIKSSKHKSELGRSEDKKEGGSDNGDEDMSDLEIPSRAPVLLRTISLGIHRASPRLTAAVLASRARVNSFDDKHSNQGSPRTVNTNLSQESDFSSVSSSVSTELACHRRVTRSVSVSSSEDLVNSADIGDFLGYEEEVGDDMTSFTTHGFYSSDDCKSNSKDDPLRQFSSTSSSMYYTSASSSSLKSGGIDLAPPSHHHDRYSIDIATSCEPEDDDEVQESPKKSSRTDSANASHLTRKAESTPNLFSDVQRSPPVYKSVVRHYSRVKDPSPIEVSGGSASSPAVARRFR